MKKLSITISIICLCISTFAHAAGKNDGIYRWKHSGGTQEVTIKGNKMSIVIGSNSGCGGSVSGELVETERLVFFSNPDKDSPDETCIVNVETSKQGLKLYDEEKCSNYHGAACSFEGVYKKVKKQL